jgi:hypothetical protein
VEADIHLDEHVHVALGLAHCFRPAASDIFVVDDEGNPGAVRESDHALGIDRVERIREPDVLDTSRDKDLSLTQLGAADARRSARNLLLREGRALVRLGVRPQAQSMSVRRGLHPLDVLFNAAALDEHCGSGDVGQLHDQILSNPARA